MQGRGVLMPELGSKHRRDLQEVLFILEEERRRNRKVIPTYAKIGIPVEKNVPEKRTLMQRIAKLIRLPKTEVSI